MRTRSCVCAVGTCNAILRNHLKYMHMLKRLKEGLAGFFDVKISKKIIIKKLMCVFIIANIKQQLSLNGNFKKIWITQCLDNNEP